MRPDRVRGDAPPGSGLIFRQRAEFARRSAMRRFGKWCGVAALMAAVLVLVADDGRGQQPFQRPGGGGGFGGMGGGAPDPDAIFNALAKGQNQINLNDPANAWMKASRERKGQAIPPNGII